MNKRKIIIDTDPGIDDAVAIAIALFSEELDVQLFTTVAGNVSIEKVTKNLLKLLPFYGKKVPVAVGASRPLIREAIDASGVHGKTGMDGYDFPEEDHSLLLEETAVQAMARVLKESPEKITLVPIGPLTNIAILLREYPEVADKIDEIVLMGGSVGRGNAGVYSEFNIKVDPEAAKIVFESGLPIVMCGLDVGLKALVYPEDSEIIKDMNPVGNMFYSLFKAYRGGSFKTGLKMYDSCAVAYLLKPEMFEVEETFVGIETQGTYTSGATVVDLKGYCNQPANAKVTVDVDADVFKEWFLDAISKCNI
ncbi:ribonucleoside hydrolase RihC [Erysipelothrix inopinata]|uniref:Ribonucleoside hydrolase RihC n=1 Tax=Erysipelothrix inopinata TaxID=225084 RepID=A0A7G9S0A3_9FIRM|nr:ribonucleoside hydrolase RihC [Erysipelothrix inopinata]QNN61278.1 ribonucleoside hydrolase RihC [Erysipelothrix inopinata]